MGRGPVGRLTRRFRDGGGDGGGQNRLFVSHAMVQDVKTLSPRGFEVFRQLFRAYNINSRAMNASSGAYFSVLTLDLHGLAYLWRIALEVRPVPRVVFYLKGGMAACANRLESGGAGNRVAEMARKKGDWMLVVALLTNPGARHCFLFFFYAHRRPTWRWRSWPSTFCARSTRR